MGVDETENPVTPADDNHDEAETKTATADGPPADEHSEQWHANARLAGEKIKSIFKH
jgi:hypothetical protein